MLNAATGTYYAEGVSSCQGSKLMEAAQEISKYGIVMTTSKKEDRTPLIFC